MNYMGEPLNDGYQCFDCGWCGTFAEAASWHDSPMCPRRDCTSLDLDPIRLCKTCRADVAGEDGDQCASCEQPFRRDTVSEVKPLLTEKDAAA